MSISTANYSLKKPKFSYNILAHIYQQHCDEHMSTKRDHGVCQQFPFDSDAFRWLLVRNQTHCFGFYVYFVRNKSACVDQRGNDQKTHCTDRIHLVAIDGHSLLKR